MTDQHAVLGAHCSLKGTVLFMGLLCKWKGQFACILPKNQVKFAIQRLQKYALFSKVKITPLPCFLTGVLETQEKDWRDFDAFLHEDSLWIKMPGLPERYLCVSDTEPALMHKHPDWDALNLQNGLPWVDATTSGEFFPHDLNLTQFNAVSFQKGCYTGQEIVARMEYLGKLKRHLQYVTLPEAKQPLEKVEQPAGKVVSIATDSNGRHHALVLCSLQK
ncbi:MAG: folate-binding protein [Gammaproteobacteria bacterium]|nr:folate-binding protein [Gammaproteobacteria bacterium]